MKKRLTRIVIEEKPFTKMRYPTLGDWYRDARRNLCIDVAAGHPQDAKAVIAVALHELIEVLLCEERGITDAQVTKWDKAHLDTDEPGDVKGCPYRREHAAASAVERAVVKALMPGSFDRYNAAWDPVWDAGMEAIARRRRRRKKR